MKRRIKELKASTLHEEWGAVLDISLLLGLEWGEIRRVRRVLEKIEEEVLLNSTEEAAIKDVIALLRRLE